MKSFITLTGLIISASLFSAEENSNQSTLFLNFTKANNISNTKLAGKTIHGDNCEVSINNRNIDFVTANYNYGLTITRTKNCDLTNNRIGENTFVGYSADDNAFDTIVIKKNSYGQISEVMGYELETKYAFSIEGARKRSCNALADKVSDNNYNFRCLIKN